MADFVVEAERVRQKRLEFYLFKMDARTLLSISYTLRRKDDPFERNTTDTEQG